MEKNEKKALDCLISAVNMWKHWQAGAGLLTGNRGERMLHEGGPFNPTISEINLF